MNHYFIFITLIFTVVAFAGDTASSDTLKKNRRTPAREKAAGAIYFDIKTHRAGNIWLTVTNFGQFGQENERPSCEFPANSAVEYLFIGAIWVGAIVDGDTLVSFGYEGSAQDREMFPGESQQDSILERTIRPGAKNDSSAVSEQDFIAVFSDTNRSTLAAPGHKPMGVKVTQKSYSWSYSYAEDFIIFDYLIKNISYLIGRPKHFSKLFMGIYIDGDCGHTSLPYPAYSFDDITGFLRVNADGDTINVAWIKDNDGDNGLTPGVTGVRVLFPDPKTISYNWWTINTANWGPTNPNNPFDVSGDPNTDAEKYRLMSNGEIDPDQLRSNPPPGIDPRGMDSRYFLSFGPFELPPDSTLRLTLAYIGGLPEGEKDEFEDLGLNARWAHDVYDNPSANGFRDGIPDFKGPPPPPSPNLQIIPGDRQVTIRWDNSSESAYDQFSRLYDFEGYRLYRGRSGVFSEMQLLGEYDLANGFGHDFGFAALNPQTENTGGAGKIWYTYEDKGLTNVELYYYAVTAYDSGFARTGLEPLESSPGINLTRAAPSIGPATHEPLQEVLVVPNPYRLAQKYFDQGWEIGTGDTQRRIDFINLPEKCTIRIYTLAGDLVATLEHDFPGRSPVKNRESWNMVSRNIQAIASGIYLFAVEAAQGKYIGKFTVVY